MPALADAVQHGVRGLEDRRAAVEHGPRGVGGAQGLEARVAAEVAEGGVQVRVVAPDGARRADLVAQPVLVVPGAAGGARRLRGVRLRCAWPRPPAHAQALCACRRRELHVPLVHRALLAEQRSGEGLVVAFCAGLAALRVARRRGRGLVVPGLAGRARGRGTGADASAGPVDAHRVAGGVGARQRVAHTGKHRGAASGRPRAGGARCARAVCLVRAWRAGLAAEGARDVPRGGMVPRRAPAGGGAKRHVRRRLIAGVGGARDARAWGAGLAGPEVIGGAQHARVLLQHVRRPACALGGAGARVGVLRAGQTDRAVDGVLACVARNAGRVADDGLDEASGTPLAQEVKKAEALLAHALVVVGGDRLVLQVALDLEHGAALAALAGQARQTARRLLRRR